MSHPRAPDRPWETVPHGPARLIRELPLQSDGEATSPQVHNSGYTEGWTRQASVSPFCTMPPASRDSKLIQARTPKRKTPCGHNPECTRTLSCSVQSVSTNPWPRFPPHPPPQVRRYASGRQGARCKANPTASHARPTLKLAGSGVGKPHRVPRPLSPRPWGTSKWPTKGTK